MRSIFAALAITVAIGVSLSGGIGIALIGFPSTVTANEPVQEMEPPLPKPTSVKCSTLEAFVYAMKKNNGILTATGENPRRDRVISLIVFPDNSLAIFTYKPS